MGSKWLLSSRKKYKNFIKSYINSLEHQHLLLGVKCILVYLALTTFG